MALDEQTEESANRIRKLKQYQFLVRPAVSEGEVSTDVMPIDISAVTTDPITGELHFPDRELIKELRTLLAAKSGKPAKELLQEQERSLARYTQVVEGQLRRSLPIPRQPRHTRGAGAAATDPQHPGSVSATNGRQGLPTRRRHELS